MGAMARDCPGRAHGALLQGDPCEPFAQRREREAAVADAVLQRRIEFGRRPAALGIEEHRVVAEPAVATPRVQDAAVPAAFGDQRLRVFGVRSEEHTSKLQSLMRISYAVFCLKKKITEKQT